MAEPQEAYEAVVNAYAEGLRQEIRDDPDGETTLQWMDAVAALLRLERQRHEADHAAWMAKVQPRINAFAPAWAQAFAAAEALDDADMKDKP